MHPPTDSHPPISILRRLGLTAAREWQHIRSDLSELWRFREALTAFIYRDLRVRYKNSVFGLLWSLANPLMRILIITIVVRKVFGVDAPNYSAFLFCAFVPWNFFNQAVQDACSSVRYHFTLVKKIYFPLEILPLSSVLANLIHFFVALLVLFIYLLILPAYLEARAFWLPLIILMQTLFTMGLGMVLAYLNVFYEDVKYLLGSLLNILFYATPIIYPIEQVPRHWLPVVLANPLAGMFAAYQKLLLHPIQLPGKEYIPLSPWLMAYDGAAAILTFAIGYGLFVRYKWSLAEKL